MTLADLAVRVDSMQIFSVREAEEGGRPEDPRLQLFFL